MIFFRSGLLAQTIEDQPWIKDNQVWREGQWRNQKEEGRKYIGNIIFSQLGNMLTINRFY